MWIILFETYFYGAWESAELALEWFNRSKPTNKKLLKEDFSITPTKPCIVGRTPLSIHNQCVSIAMFIEAIMFVFQI